MAAIHCRNGPFPPYVQEVSQISVSQLLRLFDTTEVTVIICLWKDYVLSCDRSHKTQALSFFAINLFRLQSLRAKFRRYSWESQVADGWETDGGLCPAQGAPGLSREWCRCAKDRAAPARRTVCCDQTTEKNSTTLKNTSQLGESGNWWREAFRGGPPAYTGQAAAEGLKERQQEKEEELTLRLLYYLSWKLLEGSAGGWTGGWLVPCHRARETDIYKTSTSGSVKGTWCGSARLSPPPRCFGCIAMPETRHLSTDGRQITTGKKFAFFTRKKEGCSEPWQTGTPPFGRPCRAAEGATL